jgi:hypothetical protein
VDVESVRTIGFRQVVAVLERALDPSVSLDVLEAAMQRLTELDAALRAGAATGAVPAAAPMAAAEGA